MCDGINLNLNVMSLSHNLNNAIAQTVISKGELSNKNACEIKPVEDVNASSK